MKNYLNKKMTTNNIGFNTEGFKMNKKTTRNLIQKP